MNVFSFFPHCVRFGLSESTVKRVFFPLSIAFAMIVLPAYPANPKIKTISYNSRTIYQGYVLNKQPCGEGKLYVIKQDASKIEDGNHDLLTGTFSNQTVDNATLKFASGITFTGDLSFEPTSVGIKYILSKGTFKGRRDGEEYSLPITHSITVERNIAENFKITPSQIPFQTVYGLTEDIMYHFFPVEALKSYVNTDSIIVRREDYLSLNGSYRNGEISTFDFGNLVYGSYVNKGNESAVSIKKTNGDELSVKLGYSSIAQEIVKNTLSDGVVYFDVKNEYNQPLGYAILGPMAPDNRLELDMNEEILHRYKNCSPLDSVVPLNPKLPHTSKNVKIEYADGSCFIGKIYAKYADYSNAAAVAALTSCKNDSLYYSGLFTGSDGTQQVFDYGRPLEYLEHACAVQKSNAAKRDSIARAERIAQEQAERAEQLKKREPLYQKYGKKYVDALLDDGNVLVGTPEGLVVHNMSSRLISENQYTRVYRVSSMFDSWAATIYVDVKTGKVSSITRR